MFKLAISATLVAIVATFGSHPTPRPWTCARVCPISIVVHGRVVHPVPEYKGGGIQ